MKNGRRETHLYSTWIMIDKCRRFSWETTESSFSSGMKRIREPGEGTEQSKSWAFIADGVVRGHENSSVVIQLFLSKIECPFSKILVSQCYFYPSLGQEDGSQTITRHCTIKTPFARVTSMFTLLRSLSVFSEKIIVVFFEGLQFCSSGVHVGNWREIWKSNQQFPLI